MYKYFAIYNMLYITQYVSSALVGPWGWLQSAVETCSSIKLHCAVSWE